MAMNQPVTNIKGFQGTSLLDYPGRIASLIFFGGCNLTCPFCHNPGLVLEPDQYPDIDAEELLEELQERRNFIDGVVITGGEPTLVPGLEDLLERIQGLGLRIKLDTNGLAPARLRALLEWGLVDTVALDLKTRPERYGELHTGPVNLGAVAESLRLLLTSGTDYEVRTTCVPGLVELADIHAMGAHLRGSRRWALQSFVPEHALREELQALPPHSPAVLEQLAAAARGYAEQVILRGT